ncbi:hypothetical protein N5P37_006679 [Trichoderma harzianum]|nr:hypothetical protein N5P37_006679 [Trichoderma harzianum]
MSNSTDQSLLSKLPSQNAEPLWTVMHSMVKPLPSPRAVPSIWRYNDIHALLLEAGRTGPAEKAERRVLMLVNPKLDAPFTTDTLYAGLQLINPGEVAPAHRHRSFAIRFIIKGSGAFTAVGGNKVYMEPGDLILTPKWQWHDHGHEGDAPMIWLDGLDLPLYHKLPVHFAEPYTEPSYPSKPVVDSPLRFPWAQMKAKLDASSANFSLEEYHDVATGGHISFTIGAMALRISKGSKISPKRDTCSFIFHVIEGHGKTTILGNDRSNGETVAWSKGDTFAVPAWNHITHDVATSGGDAYLFILTDKPLLENLDMYLLDSTQS